MKKKFAIIFPGNLSTYFLCLESFKTLCKYENIHFYILYSQDNNYTHINLTGNLKIFKITNEDIELIQNELGSNIKYMNSIEKEIEYKDILEKYVNQFKKNIIWTKDIPQAGLDYKTLTTNDEKCKKYLDQFVRSYYLYNKVIETEIDYDYIIRMRIDQYYDTSFLENLFYKLDNNENYNFLWTAMDNFYILNKEHSFFFQKLVENIGSEKGTIQDGYLLGSERQFFLLVNKYIENPKSINNELNLKVNITISVFTEKHQYLYVGKQGCFSKFIHTNDIQIDNFEEKFKENENIIISENKKPYIEKYKDVIFWVYTIY